MKKGINQENSYTLIVGTHDTGREIGAAAFEAGIKLGALYHQFIGMPVSPEILNTVEDCIEKSISLQPYVVKVEVRIDENMVKKEINTFGYCGLLGRMLSVGVWIEYKGIEVKGVLKYDEALDYPLMSLENGKEEKNGN